jgi:GTPase SAR1 family protein
VRRYGGLIGIMLVHTERNVELRYTVEEPPPILVAVVGPPKVGKTTLIQSLVKHYTKRNIGDAKGPITVVSGK